MPVQVQQALFLLAFANALLKEQITKKNNFMVSFFDMAKTQL